MRQSHAPPEQTQWLPGFEAFYADYVEHKIRLPNKTPKASARAIWLTYAAIICTAITATAWMLAAPSHVVGLVAVLSATLTVGAVQLRMAGTSLGAHETRNFVVHSMAEFLQKEYELTPSMDRINEVIAGAGRISPTAITRGSDWFKGTTDLVDGECQIQSVQVLGAPGPSIDEVSDGLWFGMSVEGLWSQYACDGLLARIEMPNEFPTNFTLTCDSRLSTPSPGTSTVQFVATQTEDAEFDEHFFVLDCWQPQYAPALSEPLREFLKECRSVLGPVTIFVQEKVVFLSVWFIGDVYEITSLGFALRHQAHKIAQSILLPTELAKRL